MPDIQQPSPLEALARPKKYSARIQKKLQNAKKIEDCLALQIESHRQLISNLLQAGLSAEDVAEIMLEKWQGPANRKKIISAIKRSNLSPFNPSGTLKKRRGQLPNDFNDSHSAGDVSAQSPAAVSTETAPATQ